MNAALTQPDPLIDFHRKRYNLLYDAAQEAISVLRHRCATDAEKLLLRAGVEDPDADEEPYEPDRNDED